MAGHKQKITTSNNRPAPFVNGNKRTGIATAIVILRNEGYRLKIKDKTDFIVSVATPERNVSIEQIVDWVKENSFWN